MRDPVVREKAKITKLALYGDPNYTNREKAKVTNLEKYGVEHTCASPEVIKKRVNTLKQRYGKVFNISYPVNKIDPPDNFDAEYLKGKTYYDLGVFFKVSEPTIARWAREKKLKRFFTQPVDRIVQPPVDIVQEYLNKCVEKRAALSFYAYGKICGGNYTLKMKRLFNSGKRFNSLREELFKIALHPELHGSFLKNFTA